MNDFHCDNNFQREFRDRVIGPGFYAIHAYEGRFVYFDKGKRFADIIQRRCAVDTGVQGRDNIGIGIEEKIVRWPGYTYTCFTLETHSCTNPGYESPGWMKYGKADYLLYCFVQADNNTAICYLIDFPALQNWFWPLERSFPIFVMDQRNKTMGRVVPIVDVTASVFTRMRVIK